MIAFPNIKINLGLSITEKRPDGYHNLETVFYPVALEDALEIRTSPNADRKFTLHQHGMEIAGNPEDNLVVKAYLLMDKEFHLPPVEIHLYKHIPSGAGLGGGSSDAAFMLKLLNDHYQLGVSEEQLEVYAATLGADCAFFIKNRPIFAPALFVAFQHCCEIDAAIRIFRPPQRIRFSFFHSDLFCFFHVPVPAF